MKSVVKALKASTKLNDNKILVIEKMLENNGSESLTIKDIKDDFVTVSTRAELLEWTGLETKKLSGVLLGMTKKKELYFDKENKTYELEISIIDELADDVKIAKAKSTPKVKKAKVAKYTRVHSVIDTLKENEFALTKKELVEKATAKYRSELKLSKDDTVPEGPNTTGKVLLSLELTGQLDLEDLANKTYRLIKMEK